MAIREGIRGGIVFMETFARGNSIDSRSIAQSQEVFENIAEHAILFEIGAHVGTSMTCQVSRNY